MKRSMNGGTTLCQFNTSSADHVVHAVLVLLFIFFLPYGVLAQEGRSYLDIGGGYKTGDFGTPTTSNLYYLSSAFGYVTPRYDVSLTIPFLFLNVKTAGMSNTKNGIGDIILRGGAVLIPETGSGFSLDGSLAVKFPAADEKKGLGTGEFDYGTFFGLHQRVEKFKISLLGGYIITGNAATINYNDIYLYGIGISRIINSTELYTSFEGRRAMLSGQKNPQEINVGFFHALNASYAVKGNTFAGLNKGGPDFGLSIGIVRWF